MISARRVLEDRVLRNTFRLLSLIAVFGTSCALAQTGAPKLAAFTPGVKVEATLPGEYVAIFGLADASFGLAAVSSGLADGGSSDLLAYTDETKKLKLFSRKGTSIEQVAEADATDNIWNATRVTLNGERRILVAYGYGRENRTAPLKVVSYSDKLTDPRTVFERTGERTDTPYLKQHGDKVLICYFESKYFTILGELTPTATGPWEFTQLERTRMGSRIDAAGEAIAIGRAYGDEQGQDGDVLLRAGGTLRVLPTYRGVSWLRAAPWDKGPRPELFIADGWHQNYGTMGQGRISTLTWNEQLGDYVLRLAELDVKERFFGRLIPVEASGKRYLVAVSGTAVYVYELGKEWRKAKVADHSNQLRPVNAELVGVEGGTLYLAVYHGAVDILAIKLS